MIGFLRGKLVAKQPPLIVIDVNGVGYEVSAPMSTCLELPAVGTDIQLCTHLQVREDQHTLFGFASETERTLFRDLLKVNRVGAKLALGILSGISAEAFAFCVRHEDVAALSKLPGVGKKTAERLIMDMRDKVDAQATSITPVDLVRTPHAANEPRYEALNALTSLGYKPAEANKMLESVDIETLSTEDILRSVLRSVAPNGSV